MHGHVLCYVDVRIERRSQEDILSANIPMSTRSDLHDGLGVCEKG